MNCEERAYGNLLVELRQEFPKFKIVWKSDSWLMRLIDQFLWCITFGMQCTFMTHYISTIGCTVYVPNRWCTKSAVARMIVLRHERVHMRQRRAYTFPLYAFLYLFFPLPGGLAYFRTLFEMEAYEETIRATVDLVPGGAEIVRSHKAKAKMVEYFTGPGYFWMWPFRARIEHWYDHTVDSALANTPAE